MRYLKPRSVRARLARKLARGIGLALTGLVALGAMAPGLSAQTINVDKQGLAAHGYDVVAYHVEGKPVPGDARWVREWRGARWQFASAENLERFSAEPERYAPRYGGYCAWAMARDKLADIDPEAWSVVEGKLYLNYSPRIQRKWEADRPALIEQANRNWKEREAAGS